MSPRFVIAIALTLLVMGCGNAIVGISTSGLESVKRGESASFVVFVRFTDESNSWAGKTIDFVAHSPSDMEVSPGTKLLTLDNQGNAEVKVSLLTKPDTGLGKRKVLVTAIGSSRQQTSLEIFFEVK